MNNISKKKIVINLIVIAVVLIGTIYYLLKSKIITKESLSLIRPHQVLLVFCYFLIAISMWGLVDFFVYRTIDKRFNYLVTLSTSGAGFLGSGVTPLKSGHFPFKAYFHNTRGISLENSIHGFAKCQLVVSIATIFLYGTISIIFLINGKSIIFNEKKVYLWLVSMIGFSFHLLLFVAVIVLSFNKKLQHFFIKVMTAIKMKFKKIEFNKEEFAYKKQHQFWHYRQALKEMIKKPAYYLIPVATYCLFITIYGTFQYISYLVFSGNSFSFNSLLYFFVLNLACTYITNIVPVPGGVGTAEIMFTLIFNHVMSKEIIGSVLVLWRISTYYLPIVVFAFIFFIYLIIYNQKLSKVRKLNNQKPA